MTMQNSLGKAQGTFACKDVLLKESCLVLNLGLIDYVQAWELQKRFATQRAEGQIPNLLLLLEHPHVYTIGRRGSESDILASKEALKERRVQMCTVDRGGQATYHGPGQLVGYPIIDLRQWGGPVHYIRTLEAVLVETLHGFGVGAKRVDKHTGVWVRDKKIAAIGVRVSRGVTTHGFALNVHPDLTYFDSIVPCGIPDGAATSMERDLGHPVDLSDVQGQLVEAFGRHFGFVMGWTSEAKLEGMEVLRGPRNPSPQKFPGND